VKKISILVLAVLFVVPMLFMGVGCKQEAATVEEAVPAEKEAEGEVAEEAATTEEEVGKPFEGITLKLVVTSPMITAELDREFEELTGAKIEAESTSWPDLLPKYTTTFAAESDAFDIAMIGETHAGIIGEAGWYVPLNDLIAPEDLEDVIPSYTGMFTWEGDLIAMPYMGMPYMLFYNSKVLSEAGLEVAETWEELANQSKQLQDAGAVDYGITWPLLSGDDMSSETWGVVMMSLGGQWFDENGNPAFNSEIGLEAMELIIDSIYKNKWASPSSVEVEKLESLKNLLNGRDAYNVNWSFMFPMALDPEQSAIADYAKMAPIPSVPEAKHSSWIGGAALGINPFISDERKEAALEYVKFITGKANALKLVAKGWLPMWKSVYDNPEAVELNPNILVLKKQLEKTELRPVAVWYPEFNEILRLELAPAFSGEISAQEALDAAEEKVLQRIAENWE